MPDSSSSPKRRKAISERQSREKALVIEQLRKTPIIQICCEKLGVGRTTYYDWRAQDPDFAKEADKALQEGLFLMNDLAESQLLSEVRDGNLGAITYWLKHRHPAYATKMEVKAELRHLDESLTPEQEALVERALRLTGVIGSPNNTHEG